MQDWVAEVVELAEEPLGIAYIMEPTNTALQLKKNFPLFLYLTL